MRNLATLRPTRPSSPERLLLGPTLAAGALLLLAWAGPASAAEVLQLTSGDLVPGRVVALDGEGVTFERESGGELRVAWTRVVPASRYALWQASLAEDDAAGRVELGKWCAEAGFYRWARRELLGAHGLGYTGPEDLESLVAAVERQDADLVLEDVDELVAADDPERALARLRAWLRAARPGEHADRVRARVPDVLERVERKQELAREAEEELGRAERDGRLTQWVERTTKTADEARAAAGESAVQGFTYLARGNQTRARSALQAAESGFQRARKQYHAVRTTLRTGDQAELAAERAKQCDERTVEVLVRWGRLEVGNKNWRRASEIVDRGLRLDPVQRELLELRREIDENWLRRKLSEITNAEGRDSGY